ncbi:MAG TPA: FHA domain-containing protein, partial [Vicinamibacterales bacterium]
FSDGGVVSIRFGECTLDTAARQLRRKGAEVHLSPKAFELLRLLIECRPRAVSKQELLDRLWEGVFVSDASLARVVNEVRGGIGDRARSPRWLRTVHAFGYAFSADATGNTAAPASATCWLLSEERRFALVEGEQVIGRDADVGVCLDSPRVSRRHARLVVRGARATIEDLGSKNGTFIGGTRLEAARDLKPGDTIRIGPFSLTFGVAGAAGLTETEVLD